MLMKCYNTLIINYIKDVVMKLLRKTVSVLLCIVILTAGMGISGAFSVFAASPTHKGTVTEITPYLNVRSSPQIVSNNYIGKLYTGDTVYIYGNAVSGSNLNWYKISYGNGFGYVSTDYIINIKKIQSYNTADFEAHLTAQGFPESYKVLLRKLHEKHPDWVFLADHTAMTWKEAVKGESKLGLNLVQHNVSVIPDSWKSMQKDAYTWGSANPDYVSFDSGYWVAAEQDVLEYYMEPRNFLNEDSIFMFLDQSYDPEVQNIEKLKSMLKGTFLANAFPESTYDSYAQLIMEAGRSAGVSPYVLAASILVEQGTAGNGGSISGKVSGYTGYYNFFNIGAYEHSGRSAVTNGLIYAKGSGSYGRPWNTRAKSIIGGAKWYADGYVNKGQNTLYYKKFNVIKPNANGAYYTNQYMTNVQAAFTETAKLTKAYSGTDAPLSFHIPVYKEMPAKNATALPTSKGANNYYITGLSVDGKKISNFNMFNNSYELTVKNTVASINVQATLPAGAKVTGTGKIPLHHGKNTIKLTVTAASGKTAQYVLNVLREGEVIAPTSYTGLYQQDGTWYYVKKGQVDYTYNSLCKRGTIWYYVKDGMIDWSAETLVKYQNRLYYVKNGRLNKEKSFLFKYDGAWYYVKNGVVPNTGSTLVKHNGSWFYVKNGKVDFTYNSLCKYNGSWYCLNNGKVNFNYTGLVKYNGSWYYVSKGKMPANYTNLVKHNGGWYYVRNSKLDSNYTGLVKFNGAWYYISKGKKPENYTNLVKHNGSWYYVQNSKVNFTYKGLYKYNGVWYYIKNGKIDFSYSGKVLHYGKYYTVKNGKLAN